MLPRKRRSAFSVYRASSGTEDEPEVNARERSKNTPSEPKTPWQRSKDSPVHATKMTRITSKAQLDEVSRRESGSRRESFSGLSTDDSTTSKSHGSKILTKANKLRRSLHLSGKKKKRSRADSVENGLEFKGSEENIPVKRKREIPPSGKPRLSSTASTATPRTHLPRRAPSKSTSNAPMTEPRASKKPISVPGSETRPGSIKTSQTSLQLETQCNGSKRQASLQSETKASGNKTSQTSLQSVASAGSAPDLSRRADGQKLSRPVSTYSCTSLGDNKLPEGTIQQETEAEGLLKWLLSPVKPQKFFSELWERKPLLIKRHQPTYNSGWFSTKDLDEILRLRNVQFSRNLDVTSYKDGKRETHNPQGRAHAPVVWDFYNNGCSVRLLNPQSFSHPVWKLTSLLQEYFGCFVGANTYLTPPGTQGFAPHYDDIEAFIIQLEGKKHWRLYNPRNGEETLPRYSSKNFSQDEIGETVLDTVLEPGDMLYFPRGTIHQGDTPSDSHSLHMTLSTYQKNTWGDFLEMLVPQALQVAFEEDPEFRQGLPLNYLNYSGVANSDTVTKERSDFLRRVEKLMTKLISHAPVDAAADQMAVRMLQDALPPVLTEAERSHSVYGSGASWEDGKIVNMMTITGDTDVRLIRRGVARLVSEADCVCIYHTMENSRVYHEVQPERVEFETEAGPSIECILNAFPNFVKVKDLPHDNLEFKVDMVTMLYEKGVLVTKE